ncbi:MAG: LamG domain-containing protein, partial [Armatimonadota bacterium]
MRYLALAALIVAMICPIGASAAVPPPVFYLPLDGSTVAAVSGGSGEPIRRITGDADTILEQLARQRTQFVPGRVGQCLDLGDQPLVYECAGNFRSDEGTASFWVNPDWQGDSKALYSTLFGAADWGMVYKYEDQSSLTFGTAKPDKDLYYDCGGGDLSAWRPGQWHHVVATWSRQQAARCLYLDARLIGKGPFPFAREVKSGPLFVGAGCTLYPNPTAHAKLDEFALWDKPLEAAAVQELFTLGNAGQPLHGVTQGPPPMPDGTVRLATGVSPTPPDS